MQCSIRSLLLAAMLFSIARSAPAQTQATRPPAATATATAPTAAVATGATSTVAAAAVGIATPAGFPANLRWSLVPKFIQWVNDKAQISWPPHDGCAGTPEPASLTAGELIDRFGSEGGTFFTPKGASYDSRAVPYVCNQMDYRVYRVLKPIAVKACKAAPWFNEPGGALQVQTADPAYKLVANGMIEVMSYAPGGSGGPAPQCGRP
jgi:hypothetical protein